MSKSQKYNVCDGQSYFTLLVQQVQDAEPSLDQVDTRLVISKIDQSPGDLLLHVLLLLQFEHMLCRQKHTVRYLTLLVFTTFKYKEWPNKSYAALYKLFTLIFFM